VRTRSRRNILSRLSIRILLLSFFAACSNAGADEIPGSLKGDFSVSLVGSAQYSISFSLPDGTSGMMPKLNLSYDSNSGPGAFGLGWSLVGVSAITPTPHNKKIDGSVGPVSFDDDDALSLDGGRIVSIDPYNGNQYFAKAIDDGTRIESLTDSGGRYFIARTKSGLRLYFGYDPESREDARIRTANAKIIAWPCVKVVDTFGNYIRMSYVTNSGGDWGLSELDYTGNGAAGLQPYAKVRIIYDQSSPSTVSYISGERVEHTLIAKSLEASLHGETYRRYTFSYEETHRLGSRRLKSVLEEGAKGDTHRPTSFSYTDVTPGWDEKKDFELPDLLGAETSLAEGYRFVDLDSDGVPEILYSANFLDRTNKTLRPYRYSYKLTSSGWTSLPDLALPEPLATSSGRNNAVTFFDVDGDKLVDLLVSGTTTGGAFDSKAYKQEGGKWVAHPEFAFPLPFAIDGRRALIEHAVRLPSGERGMLVYDSTKDDPNSRLWFWTYQVSGQWVGSKINSSVAISGSKFNDVDVSCDGHKRIALTDEQIGSVNIFDLTRAPDGSYAGTTYFTFSAGEPIETVVVREANCDHIVLRTLSSNRLLEIRSNAGSVGAFQINVDVSIADVAKLIAAPILSSSSDDLILFLRASNNDLATFTYDRASLTWKHANTFDHAVSPGSTRLSSSYVPLAVDLDGDRRTDLLLLPTTQLLAPIALLNTNSGWSPQSQHIPPLIFSQKDKLGAKPEFIDVNADGLVDVIQYFKDANGVLYKGAAINTASGWIGSDDLVTPRPLSYEKSGTTGVLIDVLGNGLPDFLYSYAGVHELWRNTVEDIAGVQTAGHWVLDSSFPPPPEDLSAENYGDLGVRFVDLNGDGRVDILVSRRESNGSLYSRAYVNTGSSWVETPKYRLPVPIVSRFSGDVTFETPGADYYRDLRGRFLDTRGDGGTSFLYRYQFTSSLFSGISRGCQNRDTVETKPDGTHVVHKHPIPSGTTCAGALVLTDQGWVEQADSFLPPVDLDSDVKAPGLNIEFVDLNNDGLSDIAVIKAGGGETYFNTGAGWIREPEYDVPSDLVAAGQQQPDYKLADANGDGLIDIIFSRPGVSGAYLNSGQGWIKAPEYAPPVEFVDANNKDAGVVVLDVTGSGLQALIQSEKDQNGTITRRAFLNRGSRPDVVSSVLNGMGLIASFQYRPLLTLRAGATLPDAFYTPSPISDYPVISRPPTLYAVENLIVSEGDNRNLETRYRYKGFRFDVQGQVALGFESRDALNIQSGISEHIVSNQDYELNGRQKYVESAIRQVTLSHIEYDYKVDRPTRGSFPFEVNETRELSKTYDLNGKLTGTTEKQFAYDTIGNVTSSCVIYGDGSWTFAENEYDPGQQNLKPDVWYVGRLTKARVTNASADSSAPRCENAEFGSNNSILASDAEFSYSSDTGVLESEIANSSSTLPLRTDYTRDAFGNVIRADKIDVNNRTRRTTAVQFDKDGRFVVSEQNSLGHTAAKRADPVQGVAIEEIDPNGMEVQKVYDGFGGFVRSESAEGLITSSTRKWADHISINGETAVVEIKEQTGALPPSITYLDRQGRKLRTAKIGYGGKTVLQDFKYDIFGRNVASSLPYFDGQSPRWLVKGFDILGRPTSLKRPDGAASHVLYDGTTTTNIDAKGRRTIKRTSLKGEITEVADEHGKRLQFKYGPAGRLIKTIEPDGKTTEARYDEIGNRIQSTDPDLGRWEYAYNAFGEVVWQRDAKEQISTVQYDEIGRPKVRTGPDKRIEYTYDNGPYAKGAVVSVSTSDGYVDNYEYDRNGRVQRRLAKINDEAFATYVTYDIYGRATEIYYPMGIVVKNDYSPDGFLAEVQSSEESSTGRLHWISRWRCLERDQSGRVTKELLGNGVVNSLHYDDDTGAQTGIVSENKDHRRIYNLSLKYDELGNLITRDTADLDRHEEFTYDQINRVKEWKVNGSRKASYDYDAVGRIVFKSDVGTFHYDSAAHTHAVTSIDPAAPWRGVKVTYDYDANGNMINNSKSALVYNSENKVEQIISSNELWSKFKYGPDGFRYYEVNQTPGQTTVAVTLGAYQRIYEYRSNSAKVSPDLTRHRVFVSSDTGVVAVLEQNSLFNPFTREAPNASLPILRRNPIFVDFKPTHYLLKDQLGSVARILDESGRTEARFVYDPWGRRDDLDFGQQKPAEPGQTIGYFDRGFTGHEQLDAIGLIHMNGRLYDPSIGRFVSADPTLQMPLFTQNYDRYSYVVDNPLRYIDPNGYDLWDVITTPFKKAFQWAEKNWKTIVIVVVAVVITVASYGTLGPVAAGMLAGAAAGALGAWFYGGNVFEGAFVGAVFGGLSAGFGEGLGGAVSAEFGETAGTVAGSAGRGLISGMQSEYYGGGFWQGFASGAVSQALSGYASHLPTYALRTVGAFIIGGTASVVGGGKFENAAITAAYASLLAGTLVEAQRSGKSMGEALVEFGERVVDLGTKLITLPNTALGLAWGGLGVLFGGDIPTIADWEKYNAIVFRNNPLMASGGAITFGNAVIAGADIDQDVLNHEMIHTYQAQVLGLGYLPAHAVGVTLGFASGGWAWGRGTQYDFFTGGMHGNMNFMEGSPFSSHLYGYR
jgi:RHS repeat-associated protein